MSLTVSDAVQSCAGAIGHREAARLRQLAAQAHNNKPENDSTEGRRHSMMGLTKTAGARGVLGAVASTRRLCENARQSQAASWRAASSFPLVKYLLVAQGMMRGSANGATPADQAGDLGALGRQLLG
jgi:hypothetical protein